MCDKTVDTCPFVFYYVPNWCKIQEMWYWFDMYCFDKLKCLALCFTVSWKNIWYTWKNINIWNCLEYLIISNMWLLCSKLFMLNSKMCFGQNKWFLTDVLVLKRKILYLFDLTFRVYKDSVNIEDNSHLTI